MTKIRLDRNAILGSTPRTKDIDDIPGLEGFITIRELTSLDVSRITEYRREKELSGVQLSGMYIARSVVGEDGILVFVDNDAPTLVNDLGYAIVAHITNEILEFNGMAVDDDEDEDEDEGKEEA